MEISQEQKALLSILKLLVESKPVISVVLKSQEKILGQLIFLDQYYNLSLQNG